MSRPDDLPCNGLLHRILGGICPDPEDGRALFPADGDERTRDTPPYTGQFMAIDPAQEDTDRHEKGVHVVLGAKGPRTSAHYFVAAGAGRHDRAYDGCPADRDELGDVEAELLGHPKRDARTMLVRMFMDLFQTLSTPADQRVAASVRWLDTYVVRDPADACPFKLTTPREQRRMHSIFYDSPVGDGRSLRFPRHLAFEYLFMGGLPTSSDFFRGAKLEVISSATHAALMMIIITESLLPLKRPNGYKIREPLRRVLGNLLGVQEDYDLASIRETYMLHKPASIRSGVNKVNTALTTTSPYLNATLRAMMRALADRLETATCLLCEFEASRGARDERQKED